MNFRTLFDQYLSLINRLLPKPATVPVIGIDIGTSSIKAIEVNPSVGSVQVRRWATERIENNDATTALKKIVGRLKLDNQKLSAAVSGKGSLIRYLEMPRMPLEDLRKSIVYELDKYFPFDPQSIYSDCSILDPEAKDKKMQVLIAAVKKELVDDRLTIFKEAGLELNRITINSVAAANAFTLLGPGLQPSGHAKAVLDIGGSMSSLMIFKDSSPRFTRDVFIGSQDLTRQIANALGVDQVQAEIIKCQPGDRISQVIEACDTPVHNLMGEVRLSMDYFMTEKNVQVDELFLAGGGSLLKGIESVFEKNLGIPVKIWDPLTGVQVDSEVKDIQAHAAQFTVAVGLGLDL